MKKGNVVLIIFLLLVLGYVFSRNYLRPISSPVLSHEDFLKLDYGKQMEMIKSMAESDPSAAWAYLKSNFIVHGGVVGNAHEFAHIVGNIAYKKSGIGGIKICDESFAFGCYHGVTEMMLLDKGPAEAKTIQDDCLKAFPPNLSAEYASCIHGTGHGLYSWENSNLTKSLSDCDIMDDVYRQYCYDGVFMEHSFAPENRILDPKDPWKACSGLDEKYQRNCARYQSQIFLNNSNSEDSIKTAGKYCGLGNSAIVRETCFESLGYYIAENNLGNPNAIWNSCQNMPAGDGRDTCTIGGATETVFQKYGDFLSSSDMLCKKLSVTVQARCYNNFGYLIKKQ